MNTEAIRSILSRIRYATIATVTPDGQPWNTPVFCAIDKQCNIYWSSLPESQHSQNISNNPAGFIVIYDSGGTENEGVGIYLQVSIEEVSDRSEIEAALGMLHKRNSSQYSRIEKFMGDGPQRVYRAIPGQAWTNDATKDSDGDYIRDFRAEVKLADLM